VIPPVGGGIEIPEGSRARGGSEAPEGSQAPGGDRIAPYIIVDDEEDGAPQEGSVPMGPQEGETAPGSGFEMPPRPVAPEAPIEPRPAAGAELGGLTEAPGAETTARAPMPSAGETGIHPTTPSAPGSARELQAPKRVLLPVRGMYWFLIFLLTFCFSLSSYLCHSPLAGSTKWLQWDFHP